MLLCAILAAYIVFGSGVWRGNAATAATETIFPANATPRVATSADPHNAVLGVRFESAVAGRVTGVRFYKGAGNTGTHTGALWDARGRLLATTTFTDETAGGWQTANFRQPVAIAANVPYTVSYRAPNGHYSYTPDYFRHAYSRGDLTAPAGGNGVYTYAARTAFPGYSYRATNYFVDVVFQPSAPGTAAPATTASATAGAAASASAPGGSAASSAGAVPSPGVGGGVGVGGGASAAPSAAASAAGTGPGTAAPGGGAAVPEGPGGTWNLVFDDEFTRDAAVNSAVWSQTSPAESECEQGDHGNNQAEWNQGLTNDTVNPADGLVITDLRQTVNSCDDTFTWTGGLLTSKQAFPAGDVIEEKFEIPAGVPAGGWDSFWTWCASGSNGCEVDAYEDFAPDSFGDNSAPMSDHIGSGVGNNGEITSGSVRPVISLGTWHVVDVVMGSDTVSWYLDGKLVGSAPNASPEQPYNLLLNDAVCASGGPDGCPTPAAGTDKLTENVAYVRVWSP